MSNYLCVPFTMVLVQLQGLHGGRKKRLRVGWWLELLRQRLPPVPPQHGLWLWSSMGISKASAWREAVSHQVCELKWPMEWEVSANPCACRKNTKKGKINGDLSPSLSSSIEEAKLDPGFCKGLPPILRSCMACAATSWPRGAAAQGTGLRVRPSQKESNYWGGAGWSRCLCCQITNLIHLVLNWSSFTRKFM